jgi:glutamate/aspartate transport system substrate-binding protein
MIRLLAAFILGGSLLHCAQAGEPQGVLANIKKTGVIRLGYLASSPPFSFDEGRNNPAGFSVDLCRHVAEGIRTQLGLSTLRTEWVKLDLGNRLAAVRAGKVDIECGTTTWTLSRQESVDFSLMTFVDGATVLVRGDSGLKQLADLQGRRLAVVPGTTTEAALSAALKRRGLQASISSVGSHDEGLALLAAGKVDGYASDRLLLVELGLGSKEGTNSFRVLDEDFSVEPYALTLPRGDPDLRLAVNRSLARLYRSMEVEAIFQKWLGALGRPSVLLTALYYLQGIPE